MKRVNKNDTMGGTRFISNKKHRHSDILKAEKNWDDEILNPLDIPAFPPLFKVTSKGTMQVLAKNCLDEKKLNLNCIDLVQWRESVIINLEDAEEYLKENNYNG